MNHPLLCNTLYALGISIFASLPCGSQASPPFEVEENVVYFNPEIKLESGAVCQGIRVAPSLATTSANCILKIHELSPEIDIGLVDMNHNQIATVERGDSLNQYANVKTDLLLLITPSDYKETVYDVALYSGSAVPDQNTAYYLSGSRLIEHPVTFRQPDAQTVTVFLDLETKSNLPPGTPVFNERYELVCMMTESNQCRVFSPDLIHKTRNLQQNEDEGFDEAGLFYGIYGAVAAVVITTLTASFYLVLAVQAHRKGIPMSAFWRGICSCSYCSACDGMGYTFCGIGCLFCFTTGGFCSVPLWWASAFSAGWNWVNNYGITPFEDNQALVPEPSDVIIEQPEGSH